MTALASELSMAEAPAGKPICVSGIYPHLAVFNSVFDDSTGTYRGGNEVGIGAVVPWAGKLWLVTYSPHCPRGSTDKLFTIDTDLQLRVRPESVGGTPAGRMIHRESQQLFIGPYAVDRNGQVRTIPYSRMPGRHTAIARHLTDPAGKVYYFEMEGAIHEVNVHSLDVTLLFEKPVPGWHGKGAYTGQGRFIISNNGERPARKHPLKDLKVGAAPAGPKEIGILAEWDGRDWNILERKQFTDVTGPGGIYGAPDDSSPVWAIGWDRRSVILKLLDSGQWHTFRLPKGTWTYDHWGGWYSEWPRIRKVSDEKLLMDMHGLFWDFPPTFCAADTGGLRPVSTHHRYIPDFCEWNGQIVLASDDTSLMGNSMAGQAQSNLWFGTWEDLHNWGPRSGWGGPWLNDRVRAGDISDPYAFSGFTNRCLHLAVGGGTKVSPDTGIERCTDRFPVTSVPPDLAALPRVTIDRGDYHRPAPAYSFRVDRPVTLFLAADSRAPAKLDPQWQKTDLTTRWDKYSDVVYQRKFSAGRIDIPGHTIAHKPNAYGLPHMCFIEPAKGSPADLNITPDSAPSPDLNVVFPEMNKASMPAAGDDHVTFTIEADVHGTGEWTEHTRIQVPSDSYRYHIFPADFKAEWIRMKVDRDCPATAFLHYGEAKHELPEKETGFDSLAELNQPCASALLKPGSHTRNLQALMRKPDNSPDGQSHYWEIDERMTFIEPAEDRSDEIRKTAAVTQDFRVDSASVIMTDNGRHYRLPKGDPRYDSPFETGWPRGVRECESERYLMNIHGTFYEQPREAGLLKIKPVATHSKQIMDFCTWRGLLVMSGTRPDAEPDGHWFGTESTGLWFGGIDDLWMLGKPVGKGGPWKDTRVKARTNSDPYLMTGYDQKTLTLSHDADEEVQFTVEVNIDHESWHVYRKFKVSSGESLIHHFPSGYGAHWIRIRSNTSCTATAWLVYN